MDSAGFTSLVEKLKGALLRDLAAVSASSLRTVSGVFTVVAYCDLKACEKLLTPKDQYIGQAETTVRATLDLLFNYFYIYSDPEPRFILYKKNAWRTLKNEYEKHSLSTNPRIQKLLPRLKADVDRRKIEGHVTPEEEAKVSLISWPTLKKLKEKQLAAKEHLEVMDYLMTSMYEWFSLNNHAGLSGLRQRYIADCIELRSFIVAPNDEPMAHAAERTISCARLLLTVLMTEIAVYFKFRHLKHDLLVIWGLHERDTDEGRDLYEIRYRTLISSM